MATVYREFRVETPTAEVWKALADVGAINRLITFLGDVTVDGDTRFIASEHGELVELIVAVDDEYRRVAYSLQEPPSGRAG